MAPVAQAQAEEQLEGEVERVLHYKDGFAVMVVRSSDGHEVKVVGEPESARNEMQIRARGGWTHHPKFGQQFKASSIIELVPDDPDGIEKYLASGAVAGVGPKHASELVKAFGGDVLEVIENDPERVKTLNGIGEKLAKKMQESAKDGKAERELTRFLKGLGIGSGLARRIKEHFDTDNPDAIIQAIRSRPFDLTGVNGVGFQKADTAARSLGIPADDIERLRAGLLHAIEKKTGDGNTIVGGRAALDKGVELLGVERTMLKDPMRELIADGSLQRIDREDGTWVTPRPLGYAEQGIANEIGRLMSGLPLYDEAPPLDAITGGEFNFDAVQAQAIRQALTRKVSVLTGRPGTGKTTITRLICDFADKQGARLALCAPTGRAALQMGESTGRDASTIHSMIGMGPTGRPEHDRDNPIEAEFVVVDECGMADTFTMNKLLKAVPDSATVLFVGDVDQLPSVGPGCVLRDFINAELPTARLTRVYRQGAGSGVAQAAAEMIDGQKPKNYDDCFLESQEDNEVIQRRIVESVVELRRQYGNDGVQVFSPMKSTPVGVDALNQTLQAELNPTGPTKAEMTHTQNSTNTTRTFREGDRVIQTKNQRALGIVNGDLGRISAINPEGRKVTVQFEGEREVELEDKQLNELDHAWAITIHKSQGGQFPAVIMPVTTSHWKMLDRNLYYTGITRSQKDCRMIGQPKALAVAAKERRSTARETNLAERIDSRRRAASPEDDFSLTPGV